MRSARAREAALIAERFERERQGDTGAAWPRIAVRIGLATGTVARTRLRRGGAVEVHRLDPTP